MKTISDISNSLKLVEQVCFEQEIRLTNIRRKVLILLLQAEKALSAYELIDLFESHFDEILLPITAYRTLEFLEDAQLAHRLNTANKYVVCAHIGCDHSHEFPQFLICKQCLSVNELHSAQTNDLEKISSVAQQTGYRLDSPQIELHCICTKCSSTNNKHS